MTRSRAAGGVLLRATLLVLAAVHTLPAQKHLAAFFAAASWSEAWKGFGAVIAVILYLQPVRTYARALGALWTRHRWLLVCGGWLLALVHAVPASDHLPKLLADPSWGDAWRGLGSSFACAWFIAPLRVQAAVLVALRSWHRARLAQFARRARCVEQAHGTPLIQRDSAPRAPRALAR